MRFQRRCSCCFFLFLQRHRLDVECPAFSNMTSHPVLARRRECPFKNLIFLSHQGGKMLHMCKPVALQEIISSINALSRKGCNRRGSLLSLRLKKSVSRDRMREHSRKHEVTLSAEQRFLLQQLLTGGKTPVRQQAHARPCSGREARSPSHCVLLSSMP